MKEKNITVEEENMLSEVQKLLPVSMSSWEINRAKQLFDVGVTIKGIADDIAHGGLWWI